MGAKRKSYTPKLFLHTGLTNARTKGHNRLVKQVKHVACGFRNSENSRRRIRIHRRFPNLVARGALKRA